MNDILFVNENFIDKSSHLLYSKNRYENDSQFYRIDNRKGVQDDSSYFNGYDDGSYIWLYFRITFQ